MQLQVVKQLFSLVTGIGLELLLSHQMGDYLYLEVMTRLLSSGICRQVVLLRHSMAIMVESNQFPSQQTIPGLLQDPMIIQFVCGMFR